MNVTRVLLGGLVAGLVVNIGETILNVGFLMDDYGAMLEAHNLTEPSWAMAAYILSGFLLGFVVAWLYAAIRPRYGPGPKTAVVAGTAVWLVGYFVPTVWMTAMGLTPGMGILSAAVVWGLVEICLAGMAAGWIYKERDGGAVASEGPVGGGAT